MWSDQMGAAERPCVFVDESLVAVDFLGEAPGSVPVRHAFGFDADFRKTLPRRRLAQANRSDRRDRKGNTRYAAIVRPVAGGALKEVGCNDLRIMAPHRRQRRPPARATPGRLDRPG